MSILDIIISNHFFVSEIFGVILFFFVYIPYASETKRLICLQIHIQL